jgi:hypothetical protein
MVTLDLDVRAMTILAIMILCAHNMITETAVQNKTGSSILRIVLTRTLSAFILGFVLNLIIPGDVSSAVILKDQDKISFLAMLTEWIVSTGRLVIKMVVLIMGLSFLQVLLSEFGVIRWLSNFLRPLMKFFGLPAKTSFLWIVANTLGLAYGAAIMMEETESGKITKEDANLLNHHIGISHSNLEDVLLMGSMGAMMLWMLFSRWFMSLILVWELRLEMAIRKKFVTLRPN